MMRFSEVEYVAELLTEMDINGERSAYSLKVAKLAPEAYTPNLLKQSNFPKHPMNYLLSYSPLVPQYGRFGKNLDDH